MSIPKNIHYCWFGNNPKPKKVLDCMGSWKKLCPTYEIIEWNESNFDLNNCPLYVKQAYQEKKWAFVTDYVRLKIIYDNGGIYLDTDVELKKNLDKLLTNKAFFGFEDGVHINTGLGFGAIKGHPILKDLMSDYENISFIMEDGSCDTETCPSRNTKVFLKNGLVQNDKMQILDGDIKILPSIYMCPISYETEYYRRSIKTISVHWFTSSWMDEAQREEQAKRKKRLKAEKKKDFWIHLPNRILKKIIGHQNYNKLKRILKRGK